MLDAHCRHLGANIAVGGHVIGDCLECPFHGWQYRGEDGACTSIPYSEPGSKIPPQANNLAWPVFEYAGMVCVFFHEAYDRKMSEQPDYPPYYPPPAPCESPDWQWYGRWKTRTTMHIQEFSENAADYAHFNQVHDRLAFLHRWFFLQHELSWKVGFTKLVRKHERHLVAQLPNEPHYISSFIDYPEVYFSPWPRSTASSSRAHVPAEQWDKVLELPADASWWQRLKARVTHLLRPRCIWPGFTVAIVTLIGPNSIVYFMFHTAYGDILLIKTYLPIEPLLQQVEDSWFAEKRVPRWLVNFIVTEARNAFRDDVLIWDRKTYLSKPLFVRNDGPIPKVRRRSPELHQNCAATSPQQREREREILEILTLALRPVTTLVPAILPDNDHPTRRRRRTRGSTKPASHQQRPGLVSRAK